MALVQVDSVQFGGPELVVIAGPCVIESESHTLKMAESLKKIFEELRVPFVFKSSFDKANRTSIHSYRGPGFEKGLAILKEVKEAVRVPLLVDIHLPEQAEALAEVVDIIQIPAFLCRQTDLLVQAGKTGRCVNVKKGQFLSPWEVPNIIQKLEATGNNKILITERGVTFGYNNLISDMRAIPIMQEFGYPVIFDATHSAQIPGGMKFQTGGDRKMVPVLARSAVAAGCDAVFMEVHDNVENALSDSATQWPLDRLPYLVQILKDLYRLIRKDYSDEYN